MDIPHITGYEIVAKIADGGTSTVWKARQISLDRVIALKVLNTGLVKTEEDIARFRTEAQSAAKLMHSGLCQIFDAGEENGAVYYAMEYVAGFSIGQLLARKGKVPEKQTLMIAYGVATVLGAIWNKYKVIHCDVKPDNIMIDQEGAIRIADLGLARAIGHMAHESEKNFFHGTPHYSSPEQADGAEDLDARSDIYALGATLYHMLTGQLPFGEGRDEEAMEKQMSAFLPDPLELNADISIQAAFFLEKLMVKDRHARFQNWDLVLKDIEAVRANGLPLGNPVPTGESTVSRSDERDLRTRKMIEAMRPVLSTEENDNGDDDDDDNDDASPPKDAVVAEDEKGEKTPADKTARAPGKKKPVAKKKLAIRPALGNVPQNVPLRKKPKITVTAGSRQVVRKKESWIAPLARLILLVIIVGGGYYGVTHYHRNPDAPRMRLQFGQDRNDASEPSPEAQAVVAIERTAPPVHSTVPQRTRADREAPTTTTAPREERTPSPRTPETPPPRESVRTPPPRSTPAATRQSRGERRTWSHPHYTEALELMMGADRSIQRYLKERDRSVLAHIGDDCRRAVELLESIKDEAPPEAEVEERIRQANQMIANSRRLR